MPKPLIYEQRIHTLTHSTATNITIINNLPIKQTNNSGWFDKNYEELKMLNPTMPLLLRCSDNAMPAITTEINFRTSHLLHYILQTNKFKGDTARIEATHKFLGYLSNPQLKAEYHTSRWNSPGFDPMRPFLEEEFPNWKSDPKIGSELKRYIEINDELESTWNTITNGEDEVYTHAENGLLMCQRVDLWCAGEQEVESAVKHLLNLGKGCNALEPDTPEYITEYYPGVADL